MKSVTFSILLFASFFVYSEDLDMEYKRVIHSMKDHTYEKAKKDAKDFLASAKIEGDPFFLVKAYYVLGYLCSETEDFGNAVIYYLEGARFGETSESIESKNELISIYKNLAIILADYHHYELAYKFVDKGIDQSAAISNQHQIVSLTENKINYLMEEGKYEEALFHIRELTHDFESLSDTRKVALKNKQGIALKNLQDYQSSRESYEFILNFPIVNETVYGHALHNMGILHLESGNKSEAIIYLKKAIDFKQSQQLNEENLMSLKDLADIYIGDNQNKGALDLLLTAEEIISNNLIENPENHDLYKKISVAYDRIGDTERALSYNNLYADKLEQFIKQQKEIEELDKKYNIQLLTERYFDLLSANEAKREAERIAQFGIGGTAGLFLLILIFLYFRQRNIKHGIVKEIRKIESISKV